MSWKARFVQAPSQRGGQRIAVWVTDEMARWKHDTEISWGDILKAGIDKLSEIGKPVEYKVDSLPDVQRRLEFFVKKTQELQAALNKLKVKYEKEEEKPGKEEEIGRTL